MLTHDTMYNALLSRDSSYEGIFIVAVKTTGIFCRPTCGARKPKRHNVEFYSNCKEALQNGYRPCKLCTPMQPSGQVPTDIEGLLSDIQTDPSLKIRDFQLRQRGMEPSKIRRWFLKNHGMTFHAYQRMMRINSAFAEIQSGKSVTETAFSIGYESLSGFNEKYRHIFGSCPTDSESRNVLTITRITTPLGPMYVCATDNGVCMLEFTDRRMLETEFKELTRYFKAVILPGKHPLFEKVRFQIEEYFSGSRKVFDIPIDAPGSEFQMAAWRELIKIPYGQTITYGEQALNMGKAAAVRAVGTANGHNRISIIIPCHRVIGQNGALTGYGGGLHRKKWLLDFEKKNLR